MRDMVLRIVIMQFAASSRRHLHLMRRGTMNGKGGPRQERALKTRGVQDRSFMIPSRAYSIVAEAPRPTRSPGQPAHHTGKQPNRPGR
jgi:hypothetical protein